VLELYAIADGEIEPRFDDPKVITCFDEFGPLNLQPHPGRQCASRTTRLNCGMTLVSRR
jgi:hypothetical protein